MRPNPSIYSSPCPWMLEEASSESCMLYARLLAKHRDLTLLDRALFASVSSLTQILIAHKWFLRTDGIYRGPCFARI